MPKKPANEGAPIDGDNPDDAARGERRKRPIENVRVALDEAAYPAKDIQKRESVAERLAYTLVGLLAATILLHYIAICIMMFHSTNPTDFENYSKTTDKVL